MNTSFKQNLKTLNETDQSDNSKEVLDLIKAIITEGRTLLLDSTGTPIPSECMKYGVQLCARTDEEGKPAFGIITKYGAIGLN